MPCNADRCRITGLRPVKVRSVRREVAFYSPYKGADGHAPGIIGTWKTVTSSRSMQRS